MRLWETLHDELGYPTEFIQQGRLQVAVSEEEMGELYSDRDPSASPRRKCRPALTLGRFGT